MNQINKSTFDFLKTIKKNNNREWFLNSKSEYFIAKENFEDFAQSVINELVKFEPVFKGLEIKSCVYRFNRDIRFSSDKSPYKTHFGAYIVRGGKKNGNRYAGYYLHIQPGECILAGGAYMPPQPWLNAIREKITDEPRKFLKIINSDDFKGLFGSISGEKLKSAPRGFSSDHPQIDLIKMKSYLVVNEISDDFVMSNKFFDHVIRVFYAMKPLNDFVNDTDYQD
jgi:uncharacterized protein (TIGR02453 family)